MDDVVRRSEVIIDKRGKLFRTIVTDWDVEKDFHQTAGHKEYTCSKCGAPIKYKQQKCDYCRSLISWR